MKMVRIIGRSFLDFFRDNGLMLAGSMSYFTMMALVPLCLFLVTVFGYFLGQYPDFYKFFLAKLTGFFPTVTQDITDDLAKIISYKGLGKFSLLLYWVLSYQVFASMETALNTIFKIKKKRHVFFSVMVSLMVVTLLIALLFSSFAAASLVPLLKSFGPTLTGIKIGKITKILLSFVLPFSLILCSITLLYVMVPKTKVRISSALSGAFFATGMLEIAKHMFSWYVSEVAQMGKIYGPLTAFVMFLLWIFYSSGIFLIGAEIVHNLGSQKHVRSGQ
jgi:membrane protein